MGWFQVSGILQAGYCETDEENYGQEAYGHCQVWFTLGYKKRKVIVKDELTWEDEKKLYHQNQAEQEYE